MDCSVIYVEWFFPNRESFAQKISKLGVADWNYLPVRPEFAQPPYQVPSLSIGDEFNMLLYIPYVMINGVK